jgi:hypothetical protein
VPVGFDCPCGHRWWSPPDIHCPTCGPGIAAQPDPIVWSLSAVPGTSLYLSGHLRTTERFQELVAAGIEVFVDIAGAAPYVWRPSDEAIAQAGVRYECVDGVEDTNLDLPDRAFEAVAGALEEARTGRPTLVFCAAGLKRSPHLLYGVLRSWGYDQAGAWDAIVTARPFVDPWQPYLDAAERWLAGR